MFKQVIPKLEVDCASSINKDPMAHLENKETDIREAELANHSAARNIWYARLDLQLAHGAYGTLLTQAKRVGPLSVQKAFYPEGKDCAHLYLLHPPAGIVSGDELNINITVSENAQGLVTTPGANRFYRARTNLQLSDSRQQQHIQCDLKANSLLEHLPQETLIYNDADAVNQLDVHMDGSATYFGWDVICMGLPASRQPFVKGRLTQLTRLQCNNQLLFHDKIRITDKNMLLTHAAGLNNNPVFGTLLLYAPSKISVSQADVLVDEIRTLLNEYQQEKQQEENQQPQFSATQINGLIIVRYLGAQSDYCKQVFTAVWQLCRPHYCERPASQPRIWFT